jgi:hypothetical protein
MGVMRIELLLEEYNQGIERAVHEYYRATSPAAADERAARKRDRDRKRQANMRTRRKVERDGAA